MLIGLYKSSGVIVELADLSDRMTRSVAEMAHQHVGLFPCGRIFILLRRFVSSKSYEICKADGIMGEGYGVEWDCPDDLHLCLVQKILSQWRYCLHD